MPLSQQKHNDPDSRHALASVTFSGNIHLQAVVCRVNLSPEVIKKYKTPKEQHAQ